MKFLSSVILLILRNLACEKADSTILGDFFELSEELSGMSLKQIDSFVKKQKRKIDIILSDENLKSEYICENNLEFVRSELKELFRHIEIKNELLREYKYNEDELSTFLFKEYSKNKKYIEHEEDIKKGLYAIAKALINIIQDSEMFEKDFLIQISNSIDELKIEMQKIEKKMEMYSKNNNEINPEIYDSIRIVYDYVINFHNEDESDIYNQNNNLMNDKKEEYIKSWNNRLFLHIDNNDKPITLSRAYITPDYDLQNYIERIGFLDDDSLDIIFEKYINYGYTSTMLIHGEPGIGKSSIISWMANKYKDDNNVIILRFRDWERDTIEQGIFYAVYKILGLKNKDLENKVLVVDGFDEIKSLSKRNEILCDFHNEIHDFENLKVIITSRPGYLEFERFENVIKLLPFDSGKINDFYYILTGENIDKRRLEENKMDVLGIPVILYMAIMSNIDITQSATKPELYSRIFAEKGGIFDKFSNEGVSYDKGSHILRSAENIKKYLEFLREIAFKMFEKDNLSLNRNEYKVPELIFHEKKVSVLEFPIKHLFESTIIEIEFIHKSIYEYFVSEYLFVTIKENIYNSVSKEEKFASIFGELFKSNRLSKEICEFLKYRISNSYPYIFFETVNDVFHLMLQSGMTYYIENKHKNIICYEMNVFANMLDFIHLWDFNIFAIKCEQIVNYLGYKQDFPINLCKMYYNGKTLTKMCLAKSNMRSVVLYNIKCTDADLQEADLTDARLNNAYLAFANLRAATLTDAKLVEADLRKANLRNADLIGTDLKKANLYAADIRGALLVGVKLDNAILNEAIFSDSQITYLERKYNLSGTRVYIEKTKEIIRYEKYQKKI